MNIARVLKENPWMEAFKDQLIPTCHDCAVGLGEVHIGGCDAARCSVCGGQLLSCSCPDGRPDIWTGLMMPDLHKICLERNLWCRDFVTYNGKPEEVLLGRLDTALMAQLDGRAKIRWHVPCEKDDPGSHADLNRASCIRLGQSSV
jgi:hypothetical protein